MIFSLKKLFDEKEIISAEDFEEAIALDKILARQEQGPKELFGADDGMDFKKAVN